MKLRPAILLGGGIAILSIAIIVADVAKSGGSNSNQNPTTISAQGSGIFLVRRSAISHAVQAAGTVVQPDTAKLTFDNLYTLTGLDVQVGSRVTAGQVLAQEDTSALAQTVSQDKASLDAVQAQLQKLEEGPSPQDLAADKLALEVAQHTYQKAMDDAQYNYQTALLQAKDNLATAQAQFQATQTALQNDGNNLAQQENLAGFDANGQPKQFPYVVQAESQVASDKANIASD